MTWVWITLAVWLAGSPIVGVAIGRAVAIAEDRRARTLALVH